MKMSTMEWKVVPDTHLLLTWVLTQATWSTYQVHPCRCVEPLLKGSAKSVQIPPRTHPPHPSLELSGTTFSAASTVWHWAGEKSRKDTWLLCSYVRGH